MAIGNRLVLRSGFSIIIGLLVISAVMAWRIHETFSQRSYEIHHNFVQQREVLTILRTALWMSVVEVRDFSVGATPDPNAAVARLVALRRNADQQLERLKETTRRKEAVAALELQFSELWSAVEKVVEWDEQPATRYAYIQGELSRRRDEVANMLRDIERWSRHSLTASEEQLQETRDSAARRLLAMLATCVICGLLVAQFSIRYSDRLEGEAEARFAEVSEAKAHLEHLSARLMEVQEEERTRLSHELHDEVVQNLAVLKMEIVGVIAGAGTLPPRAAARLSRARELAEKTVAEVRNISVLLRPSLLDDLGLGPALQWQIEEFTRRTGVRCELAESGLADDLPDTVKTCVYRVTQEALRNCEKHSGATAVRVIVTQTEKGLDTAIEDNGSGFPAKRVQRPSSLGVLGMKERAAALGGRLETSNRPEGGACVHLHLPLAQLVASRPAYA